MSAKRPQFSAKFKAGVRYLRHKNGIVYPFNPQLEKNPNYTVVVFKQDVRIEDRPLGYIPPQPVEEDVVEEAPKKPAETTIEARELQGSLAEGLESAVPTLPANTADQLSGGLDIED